MKLPNGYIMDTRQETKVSDDRESLVAQFHEATEQALDEHLPTLDLLNLRMALICEEVNELRDAASIWYEATRDRTQLTPHEEAFADAAKEHLLKELADVQYTISGFAVTFGLPLGQAFGRVHDSSMTKLQADGTVKKSDTGKVLKGPFYREPDLSDLI